MADLELTKVAETASTITLGWTPPPGAQGYLFYAGGRRSSTLDGSRSTVKFSKGLGPYRVQALGLIAEGTYPTATSPPASSGPTVITKGGTYTGNWTSTNKTVAAVRVSTTDPVTITGSVTNLAGGPLILSDWPLAVNVTIDNVKAYGGTGRFLELEGFKSVVVRNCTIEKTSGICLIHGVAGSSVLITRNKHRNIQDGGYLAGTGGNPGNFVQLREVQNATVAITWNEIVNEYNVSWPEDLVSIYKSANVTLADNYFQHQSTPGNAYNTSSQSTITLDGDGSGPYVHDVQVLRNQIVDCVNGGYITGTARDCLFSGNRVIQDGKLPDGVTRMGNGYSAMSIQSGAMSCHMHGNVLGYVGRDGGRTDWDANLYAPEGRAAEIALNTTLVGPITLAMEQAEWTSWLAKLDANGVTVGTSV